MLQIVLVKFVNKKKISLERKVTPQVFFSLFYGYDWKRYRRYETTAQALQGYYDATKHSWNCKFEWRIHTPVGYVRLPVVKA